MTEIYLKVTIDGQASHPRYIDVDDVLAWRYWLQHEADKIAAVSLGNCKRFSTRTPQGVYCDLEPDDRQNRAKAVSA